MEDIVFVGGARDYHAMDWYRTVKSNCSSKKIAFVTDLIESEGFKKLVSEDDNILKLFIIDDLLFRNPTRYGDIWRNIVKLLVVPLQVIRLRGIAKRNSDAVFHALPMYYMFLCWLARVPYIGTPQGSEILVRPNRSRLYRYFAARCLTAAQHVTVDSVSMQEKIFQLCGKKATVIQNGIDVTTILRLAEHPCKREHVVSIRGFAPLYRIENIIDGRNLSLQKPRLHFIYPFEEGVYKSIVSRKLEQRDVDLGRLSKAKMYELLGSSKLVISIPESDSSPRSVYEAIFCGCCVAVTSNPWIDAIPECMKARLCIVSIEDRLWFEKALAFADSISAIPYKPSEAALNLFDQKKAMQLVADLLY